MKNEIREIYTCDYCEKYYKSKRFAELHEKRCHKNPDNSRVCFDCDHLRKVDVEYYSDIYHGETSRMLKVFYCNELDIYLYPPIVEHKGGSDFDFGDKCNEPMKKNCDKFKEQTYE